MFRPTRQDAVRDQDYDNRVEDCLLSLLELGSAQIGWKDNGSEQVIRLSAKKEKGSNAIARVYLRADGLEVELNGLKDDRIRKELTGSTGGESGGRIRLAARGDGADLQRTLDVLGGLRRAVAGSADRSFKPDT